MGIEPEPTRRSTGRTRPIRADGLLDLNVLPQRHRRVKLHWASVAPWLSLLGLIALVYPTLQWFLLTNQGFSLVARDLAHNRATQIALQTPSGTESALTTQIADAKDQAQQLQTAAGSVDLQQVAWGETIQLVLDMAPLGTDISTITQEDNSIEMTGQASTYQVPLAYAQRLKDTGRFTSVSVDIIRRNVVTSPTPGAAATPTSVAEPSPFTFRLSLWLPNSNVATPVPEATLVP